jgi:hypothetical protein
MILKMYFSRLMRVYDGLIMLAACSRYLIQVSLLLIGLQALVLLVFGLIGLASYWSSGIGPCFPLA